MNPPDNTKLRTARIQIWGKGYRVTSDTEEFQRYVPLQPSTEVTLEKTISTLQWGRILEPIYALPERDLAAQRCMLFNPSELMALSFSKTEDKHRRPSVTLITATSSIDWTQDDIGETAARTSALVCRLALDYGGILKGNPEELGTHLRNGNFLPSREFDLVEEHDDRAIEWGAVLGEVKKWRGIHGVATPRLLSLGANIVLGTRHEAERSQQNFSVDGYFDIRDKEIRALSTRLDRWPNPPAQLEAPTANQPSPPSPDVDIRPISESLARIEQNLERIFEIALDFRDFILWDKKKR